LNIFTLFSLGATFSDDSDDDFDFEDKTIPSKFALFLSFGSDSGARHCTYV
jgi:hypothetical protein